MTVLLLFLALFLLFQDVHAEGLWQMTKKDDGIVVYQKDDDSSDLKQFMGIMSINVSPKRVFDIIRDTSSNRFWMADCIHSEMVARISDTEIIAYYITSPPWPVDRRDSLIRIRFTAMEQGKFRIDMNSLRAGEAELYVIKKPDTVRIYRMNGFFGIEEKQGKSEIVFCATGEAGGAVPDFLVRWGGWRIPYNTLTGLRTFPDLYKGGK